MADLVLDDVRELLSMRVGDEVILRKIESALEGGEVISQYERRYVHKLAEEHLRTNLTQELVPESRPLETAPVVQKIPPAPTKRSRVRRRLRVPRRLRSKKLLIVLLAAIILVGGSAAVYSAGVFNDTGNSGVTPPTRVTPGTTTPPASAGPLSIRTDSATYGSGDIVAISGTSNTLGTVSVSITNTAGVEVWRDDIRVKPSGAFTTLLIVGGSDWGAGTYTIKAAAGGNDATTSFSITS